mgnify:CR=1 FL=1
MNFLQEKIRIALERSSLKIAVICLSLVSLTFGVMLALDLSREPVVIDRACETNLVKTGSAAQTNEEVEAFVKEAVALRFNSAVEKDPIAYMTQDLFIARAKEQEELKRGGVDQRLIVRAVKLEGSNFVIEADRLVAVQKVRSAIPIRMVAKVSSKDRSVTNPYGLVLTSIDQQKEVKND